MMTTVTSIVTGVLIGYFGIPLLQKTGITEYMHRKMGEYEYERAERIRKEKEAYDLFNERKEETQTQFITELYNNFLKMTDFCKDELKSEYQQEEKKIYNLIDKINKTENFEIQFNERIKQTLDNLSTKMSKLNVEHLNILLIGPSGVGKSFLINTLLKLEGNKVKIIDVKNFLICILDLQNYNFYQLYKSAHEQDLKDIFPPDKFKKEDIPELITTKQNEELLATIDKKNKLNNKYFSISTDNKIIFVLDKVANIKKDYDIFALNYRNQKKKGKDDKIVNMMKLQCPFKPEINEKSNKIYQKYKDKVLSLQNETVHRTK